MISGSMPIVIIVAIVVVGVILFSKYLPSLFGGLGGALGNTTGNLVKSAVVLPTKFSMNMNQKVFGHAVDNPNKAEKVVLKTGLAGGAVVAAVHKLKGIHIGKLHF